MAKQTGARLAIVNREPTEMDDRFDVVVHADAGPTLTEIVEAVERVRS
jgi:NAD-dependent deacetylase